MAGGAGIDVVRHGKVGCGKYWYGRFGGVREVRSGEIRKGLAGEAWSDQVRYAGVGLGRVLYGR